MAESFTSNQAKPWPMCLTLGCCPSDSISCLSCHKSPPGWNSACGERAKGFYQVHTHLGTTDTLSISSGPSSCCPSRKALWYPKTQAEDAYSHPTAMVHHRPNSVKRLPLHPRFWMIQLTLTPSPPDLFPPTSSLAVSGDTLMPACHPFISNGVHQQTISFYPGNP